MVVEQFLNFLDVIGSGPIPVQCLSQKWDSRSAGCPHGQTPLQLDGGKLSLLLLLNVTAVFDMVNHDLLTHHLAEIGLCGIVFLWLT